MFPESASRPGDRSMPAFPLMLVLAALLAADRRRRAVVGTY